jgi:DNA-binding NarL/FixJ family response regulator
VTTAPTLATRTRVLVASDRAATRALLAGALGGEFACAVAATPDDAAALAARRSVDVTLLEFRPISRLVRALAAIGVHRPNARTIVLARRLDEGEMLAAVRAGASGYVSLEIPPERLAHVIRRVHDGEAAIPRALVERMAAELRDSPRPGRFAVGALGPVHLTVREAEVVDALRRGCSTVETAHLLGISAVTVRRHVSALHQKLGTGSREELAHLLAVGTLQ